MEESPSDLVRDSKLESSILDDYTIHTKYISNPATGERRTRVEERWQRTKELGRGSYGVVWLEKCTSGPGSGQLRAVKELRKEPANVSPIHYHRELEAIAKFSHERVRPRSTREIEVYAN
jgi:hypothetical protein